MPPLPTRLFIGAEQTQRIVAHRKGVIANDAFGELPFIRLPGKRAYPVSYVRAALRSRRVLSAENARSFRTSPAGKEALAAAKTAFENQLRTFTSYSDPEHPRLVTMQLLATTLFFGKSTVALWCKTGQIPCTVIEGKYYFDPDELLEHFEWSI